jgi:predicted DNA-binding protein with PD1-like motif
MEHARRGDLLMVRLDRGEEVVSKLVEALSAAGAPGAVVITGLGACEEVEIAYYDPVRKAYDRKVLAPSQEIVALSGIVARGPDGVYQPHFHIVVAGPDHRAEGGHLFRARVSVLAEFALRTDVPAMRREPDPVFGLGALRLA